MEIKSAVYEEINKVVEACGNNVNMKFQPVTTKLEEGIERRKDKRKKS